MKLTLLFLTLLSLPTWSSVVGISTHPLSSKARVFSAEMTGYMSERNEMSMGVRYTQEAGESRLLDFSATGGQDSRALMMGAGMDFELLSEEVSQPRVSLKPFIQYQKFENDSFNLMGAAPMLRKGFSIQGQEVFPYLAFPVGMKIDTRTNEFVYHASSSFGASLPVPAAGNKLLLSLEGNLNLGASSDYIGCLVSWVWK